MPLTYAPKLIEHPSQNHGFRRTYPGHWAVDTILLHHTASAQDAGALAWLCNPASKVSAHYLVGTKGDIWHLVPEGASAWHAGMGRLPWETCPEYDFNHRSIGIEIVNPGDGKTPFTEAQYVALAWLVPDIAGRLHEGGEGVVGVRPIGPPFPGLRCVFILGHRDVAPGRKTDPADNFDWARIREALSPARVA